MKKPRKRKKNNLLKEWAVYNDTDRFFADTMIFTQKQAKRFVINFPKRYENQGYYRDKNMNKIDPKSVILTIRKINL